MPAHLKDGATVMAMARALAELLDVFQLNAGPDGVQDEAITEMMITEAGIELIAGLDDFVIELGRIREQTSAAILDRRERLRIQLDEMLYQRRAAIESGERPL